MPLGVIAILKVAEGRNVEFEQLAAQLATKVIKNESKCNRNFAQHVNTDF